MKRKLFFGLGIISAIFIASGAIMLWNLNVINSGERVMDRLDQILDRYGAMVDHVKNAQSCTGDRLGIPEKQRP